MKTLTKKLLLKDYSALIKCCLFSIFVIAGLLAFFSPIVYCKDLTNCLLNMAFMLIIAIPFCWIGLKNIIEILDHYKKIKAEELIIVEDIVIDKEMRHHGSSSDTSDSYCQLCFEKHSSSIKKNVVVRRSVYDDTKLNDKFYLIYFVTKKGPILSGFYPTKYYTLDESLTKKVRIKI